MSERRTRLCVLSEFPGENYYSLKILKGDIEPRRNLPGSCAVLHVDYSMCRLVSAPSDFGVSISFSSDSSTLHNVQLEEDDGKPKIGCELYRAIESYPS